ncbi:hypothetical protein [Hymenobacter koreensis]|uniref:Phage portal protein n=1 Tax=Hymenobacter koreensis TaxID=1084523 RepID=A0ABP8JJH3_9BACT
MKININEPLVSAAAYPNLAECDPRKKNKAYILQYGRAHVSAYLNSSSRDFLNGRLSGRYRQAELYATGHQDAGQYAVLKDESKPERADKDGFRTVPSGATKTSKLDRRILELLPKRRRSALALLREADFDPIITFLDAVAQEEKAQQEAKLRAWMNERAGMSAVAQEAGMPVPNENDIPLDEDELKFMLAEYKVAGVADLETQIVKAMEQAAFAEQERACESDDATYGSSVVYMALAGNKRLPRRVHPGDALMLPSQSATYQHLQAGAHVERVPLAQVLHEIEQDKHTTLQADELEHLKQLATPASPNGTFYYDPALGEDPVLGGTLEVIRFSFISTDEVVKTDGQNKVGNRLVRDHPATYTEPKNPNRKVVRQKVSNVYEGTLINNTAIGYGCRLAHEQLRDEKNPFVAHPFYVVTTPDLLGGLSNSLVEQGMVPVDFAMREWMRLQDVLATAVTHGIQINKGVLEQVVLEKGTTPEKAEKDILEMFFKKKVLVYHGLTEDGTPLPPPIQQFINDISPIVNMHWANIQQAKLLLEEITGVNGAVSGANPASRQGKGVTDLAIAGAENAMGYLFDAKQWRIESVYKAIARSLKGHSEAVAVRDMDVKVERKPTQEQWARFYAAADKALETKEITLADFAYVTQVDNLKQAYFLLSVRAKRNMAQQQQMAQQNTEFTTQAQIQSAQEAEKAKQSTIQMQAELDMRRDAYARETQLMLIQAQGQVNMQTAQLGAQAKLQAAQVVAESTEAVAAMREAAQHQRAGATLENKLELEAMKPKPSAA